MFYFSFIVQQPLVGLGVIIIESSRSHSDTLHPVGLLWTNYQSDEQTSTLPHRTLTRDRQPFPRRDSNTQFEHDLPTNERQQAHNLVRAITGIGRASTYLQYICTFYVRRTVTMQTLPCGMWRPVASYQCFGETLCFLPQPRSVLPCILR
jgi:hypothetical protein